MSNNTSIEWTDITDNIMQVATGGHYCCKVSPGCANCYAEKINQNAFFGGNGRKYAGPPPLMVLRQDIIDGWARMRLPKRHFVCSMTDIFGGWVSQGMATNFLRGMWRAPQQTFQVLTKRPEIALDRILAWLKFDGLSELPANIWIGTSVENQEWADRRIPVFLKIPAKTRFLSIEPLLGPVDLNLTTINHDKNCHGPAHTGPSIDWLIIGGESGPKARACQVPWVRSLVEQGKAAGVATFVKQLGSKVCCSHSWDGLQSSNCVQCFPFPIHHKKGGDMAEWPLDLRVRQFPADDRQQLIQIA